MFRKPQVLVKLDKSAIHLDLNLERVFFGGKS